MAPVAISALGPFPFGAPGWGEPFTLWPENGRYEELAYFKLSGRQCPQVGMRLALATVNYREHAPPIRGASVGIADATAIAAFTNCAMVHARSTTPNAFAGVVRNAS